MATETRFTVTIYIPEADIRKAKRQLEAALSSRVAYEGWTYEVDAVDQYETEE